MKIIYKLLLIVVLLITIIGSSIVFAQGQSEEMNFTVFAGSHGGTWHIVTLAAWDLFSEKIPGLTYSIVPGGGVANIIALNRKDGIFGMGYTDSLVAGYYGREPYEEEMRDLRGMYNFHATAPQHAFITKSSNINSFRQIAEQQIGIKVDTGPIGTGGELMAKRIFEAYGITYEKIKEWGGSVTHSPYQEALGRVRDGHINMWINTQTSGEAILQELATSRDVILLPIDDEIREELIKKYGYNEVIIPAGTYKGTDVDISTITQNKVTICHKDAPEELVYTMTKLVFENLSRLRTVHIDYTFLKPETAVKGWPSEIPLHPGAERYYKEIGILE